MTIRQRITRTASSIRANRGTPKPAAKVGRKEGTSKRHKRIRQGEVVAAFDNGDTPITDMLKGMPGEQSEFRAGDNLHVSDLVGKCVRRIALSIEANRPMPPTYITHSMGMTFAQGTAIHDYVKGIFKKQHRDDMYGTWHCLCKRLSFDHATYDEIPHKTCDVCGTEPDNYDELVLVSPSLRVVGSPDIVIYMRRNECYYPIEIKSMSHDEWKEIVRPKPDHVVQVMFYWYLLRELGYAVSKHVSVLYATKGFIFKGSPYKEFVIDAESSLGLIDDYIEDAKALVRYYELKVLPARTMCSSMKHPVAKACHVSMECFG